MFEHLLVIRASCLKPNSNGLNFPEVFQDKHSCENVVAVDIPYNYIIVVHSHIIFTKKKNPTTTPLIVPVLYNKAYRFPIHQSIQD